MQKHKFRLFKKGDRLIAYNSHQSTDLNINETARVNNKK